MKKTIIILFGLILSQHLCAQETIPMPTQAEWDSYLENRFHKLQQTIYQLIIDRKLKPYSNYELKDTLPIKKLHDLSGYRKHRLIEKNKYDDNYYTFDSVFIKPLVLEDYKGISFLTTVNFLNSKFERNNCIEAIGLRFNPWLAGGIQDDDSYTIFYCKIENIQESLLAKDITLLQHLMLFSRQITIDTSNAWGWRTNLIFDNVYIKHSEDLIVDDLSIVTLKKLLSNFSLLLEDIDDTFIFDHGQNRYLKPNELEDLYDGTKTIFTESGSPFVATSITFPTSCYLPKPFSITFTSDSSIKELTFRLDSSECNLTKIKKNEFNILSISQKSIQENQSLSHLTWWLEDYYSWTKRVEK